MGMLGFWVNFRAFQGGGRRNTVCIPTDDNTERLKIHPKDGRSALCQYALVKVKPALMGFLITLTPVVISGENRHKSTHPSIALTMHKTDESPVKIKQSLQAMFICAYT